MEPARITPFQSSDRRETLVKTYTLMTNDEARGRPCAQDAHDLS